jgi:hypothetical protein
MASTSLAAVPETAATNLTSRISFRAPPWFGQAPGTEPLTGGL